MQHFLVQEAKNSLSSKRDGIVIFHVRFCNYQNQRDLFISPYLRLFSQVFTPLLDVDHQLGSVRVHRLPRLV